ncbi:hypothetical protein A946_01095 [Methylacidiphilum kamchatkense Kam1]|uniref:Uncharacterized protein n=1 Tax=Methylacidiphilum kamchatkense Kam1 TaxID=1202785 RepID=A0ABR4ZYN7_9BACT|nr:hypothetical protein [Methylacidiphilum kamchatkense]KIE59337.1 hypothetical protein A946_01095 [Methylacidiphilum kamchatkense Kam1]
MNLSACEMRYPSRHEHFAKVNGCEWMVLNQERLSAKQEMVQERMTILPCFSFRLDGLRNYRD